MIDDWGMLTPWVYDSGDELDEGDVAPCGSVMKGTRSAFIFLTQDLWALPHQVLQESEVALLGQLEHNGEEKRKRHLSTWTNRYFNNRHCVVSDVIDDIRDICPFFTALT